MGKQVAGLEGLNINWQTVLKMEEVWASVRGARDVIEARANDASPVYVHYGGDTQKSRKSPFAKGIVYSMGRRSNTHELRHNTLLSSL